MADIAKADKEPKVKGQPTLVKIVRQFEGDEKLLGLLAFNETYQNIQFLN